VLGALTSARRIVEYGAHHGGGRVEVGIGPLVVGRIRMLAFAHIDQLEGHEPLDQIGHELEVAAVLGGDDGSTQRQRVGQVESEALTAMQRDHTVSRRDQTRVGVR